MVSARAAQVRRRSGSCLLLCLSLAGCDDGAAPAPGPTACEWVNAKRAACCLEEFECVTAYDECYSECLVGWGCEEQVNPNDDPGISACLWNCSPRFTCNDGLQIYEAFRCDGDGDCRDLEDEENCPVAPTSAPSSSTAASMVVVPGGGAAEDADLVDSNAPRDAMTVVDATTAFDATTVSDGATSGDASHGSTVPVAATSACDATGLLPPVHPTPVSPGRNPDAAVLDAAVAGDSAVDGAVSHDSGVADAALSHDNGVDAAAAYDAAAHREGE